MAFTLPTNPVNGQVFITTSGTAYTYNSVTSSWSPGFIRSQLVNQSFSANNGQTIFSVLGGYVPPFVDVYLRGIKLASSDFIATNGTTIILNNVCKTGDDVQVRGFSQFSVANAVQRYSASGDTLDNVTIGGIKPAPAITTSLTTGPLIASSINGGQLAGFRNKIINGSFMIDQRNEGSAYYPGSSGLYCMDRWVFPVSQVGKLNCVSFNGFNATNYGVPFNSSIYISSNGSYSPGSGEFFQLSQAIEGVNFQDLMWGTVNAKPVTLSFYAAVNTAGTYAGRITYNGYSYVFTFALSGSATYVSITVPGCQSGSANCPVGQAVATVTFDMGGGSARQTTVTNSWQYGDFSTTPTAMKLISISSGVMIITGVQLEMGTQATPFEFRSHGTELSLCQRYFEKSYSIGSKVGFITLNGAISSSYLNNLSPAKYTTMLNAFYKTAKCFTPTVVTYSPNSGASGYLYDNINNQDVSTTLQFVGTNSHTTTATMLTANTAVWYTSHWTAQSEIQ